MIKSQKTVGVLGGGTMGSGIAIVMAQAGQRTILFDLKEENLQRGIETVNGFFDVSVKKGKLTPEQAEESKRNVTGTTTLFDLAPCEVVVEAVFEDIQVKKDAFAALDEIVSANTLFHTNTSTLSVTGIAAGSKIPGRVVGTHYCNPAPLMSLVEVARGRHTDNWAYNATVEFLESINKTTVVTKDRPGFIVNRFLIPWENSCIDALENGLGTKESIDAAVKGALGHPMGPFQLLDIIGMDIHQQVATRLYEQLRDPRFFPPAMVDRMVAAGDLGRKTGRGFYEYDNSRLFGS